MMARNAKWLKNVVDIVEFVGRMIKNWKMCFLGNVEYMLNRTTARYDKEFTFYWHVDIVFFILQLNGGKLC